MLFIYLFLKNKHRHSLCLPVDDIYRPNQVVENSLKTCVWDVHMHDGHADSPPPLSLFFFFLLLFSLLGHCCLTKGYELYCLLSGLVQGCVWAWLTEIPEVIAVRAPSSLGATECRTQPVTASKLCRPKGFSVSSSLSNQPPALTLPNVSIDP